MADRAPRSALRYGIAHAHTTTYSQPTRPATETRQTTANSESNDLTFIGRSNGTAPLSPSSRYKAPPNQPRRGDSAGPRRSGRAHQRQRQHAPRWPSQLERAGSAPSHTLPSICCSSDRRLSPEASQTTCCVREAGVLKASDSWHRVSPSAAGSGFNGLCRPRGIRRGSPWRRP